MAQRDIEATLPHKSEYDSVRSLHIKNYPDHFSVWPVLKQRKLDFEMRSLPGRNRRLEYRSNRPYSFGVGAYLFELVVELAFAIPLDERNKRIYGESNTRDLQLNILAKRWGLDVYRQRYSGFYIVNPEETVPPDMPFPQRADIKTRNIGMSGNYTFDHKRFSLRSAYNYVDRQLHSSGSWLAFLSVNSFRAEGDSAIIEGRYGKDFGVNADINRVRTTILGIAPGYTYSIVYKGFFLNGTLAVGPAHNWLAYQLETGQNSNDIRLSLFINARIGLGYNSDRFFGGFSFINQGRNARFENLELTSSNSTFKILFGYRFKEFGILQKRIWDLPKELF